MMASTVKEDGPSIRKAEDKFGGLDSKKESINNFNTSSSSFFSFLPAFNADSLPNLNLGKNGNGNSARRIEEED